MDEATQRKYVEFQSLNSQMSQLQQQIMNIEQQILELRVLVEGVEDIKKAKAGDEILASLGSGIFVKASLKNNDEVLMNVGAGTVVSKTAEEAKAILERQQADTKRVIGSMTGELQKGVLRLRALQSELQQSQQKL